MSKKVTVEGNLTYLTQSEKFQELPGNCLFDKGKVGCGGTTIAIESNYPYVIAVPFVSLIENKVKQHKGLFAVYSGVTQSDIKEYIRKAKTPKIMTTFDSLHKVVKAVGNPKLYKLLVDEYHLLFTQYAFRDKAVNVVLNNFSKFGSYTFMTATKLEDEFILDELKDLPVVEAVWDNVSDVNVKSVYCKYGVTNSVVDIIQGFLSGKYEGNAYFFVNSVKFIKTVVKEVGLTEENCNVIYSNNNNADVGIERGELPSDKSGKIKPKKINLLTSTVFEGSDIYDEDGKIFIVSDAEKAHTLIDISTSFQQIAGRIRDSKYINSISHLYSTTRYNNLSYEEFKKISEKEIEGSKIAVREFNSLSENSRMRFANAANGTYISFEDYKAIFNANLVKLDMYNFKITKFLYKLRINLNKEMEKNGIKNYNYQHTTEVRISDKDITEGFDEVVKRLKKIYSHKTRTPEEAEYIEAAFKKYTFLEKAIEQLGFEGIEDLNYVQTNIRRKLINNLDSNKINKTMKHLKTYSDISAGNFIPASTLKNRFKKIYKDVGVNKTAKGSDIGLFFETKSISRRINGKLLKGYQIIRPKVFFG